MLPKRIRRSYASRPKSLQSIINKHSKKAGFGMSYAPMPFKLKWPKKK